MNQFERNSSVLEQTIQDEVEELKRNEDEKKENEID